MRLGDIFLACVIGAASGWFVVSVASDVQSGGLPDPGVSVESLARSATLSSVPTGGVEVKVLSLQERSEVEEPGKPEQVKPRSRRGGRGRGETQADNPSSAQGEAVVEATTTQDGSVDGNSSSGSSGSGTTGETQETSGGSTGTGGGTVQGDTGGGAGGSSTGGGSESSGGAGGGGGG